MLKIKRLTNFFKISISHLKTKYFSRQAGLTCGAPQGTKLATLLFLAVINFVFSEFKDRFKYVDNLSVLLKHLIVNSEAVPQFSGVIMSNFKDQYTINSLQINEGKAKILLRGTLQVLLYCILVYFWLFSVSHLALIARLVIMLIQLLKCQMVRFVPLSDYVVLVFLCPNLRRLILNESNQSSSMLALYWALKWCHPYLSDQLVTFAQKTFLITSEICFYHYNFSQLLLDNVRYFSFYFVSSVLKTLRFHTGEISASFQFFVIYARPLWGPQVVPSIPKRST